MSGTSPTAPKAYERIVVYSTPSDNDVVTVKAGMVCVKIVRISMQR